MIKKYLLTMVVGTLSLGSSLPALASADSTSGTVSSMTKDEWLGKLQAAIPTMICKNFTSNTAVNQQLTAANIDYNRCVELIPSSVTKCKTQYYENIPATINKDNAQTWGNTIAQCIGADFATTHLTSANVSTSIPSTTTSSTSTSTDSTHTSTGSFGTTDTTSSTNNANSTLTKDEWLGKLKSAVPDLICKGFLDDKELNARLTKLNIDFNKCVTLIPPSVDKCEKEFYDQIPATINHDNAGQWGHKIGECIGKEFALKHLLSNSSSQ